MSTSDDQNYQRLQRIFLEALERAPGEARDAYLKGACGGEAEIRESLDALLKEYEEGADSAATCGGAPNLPLQRILRLKLLRPLSPAGFLPTATGLSQ